MKKLAEAIKKFEDYQDDTVTLAVPTEYKLNYPKAFKDKKLYVVPVSPLSPNDNLLKRTQWLKGVNIVRVPSGVIKIHYGIDAEKLPKTKLSDWETD